MNLNRILKFTLFAYLITIFKTANANTICNDEGDANSNDPCFDLSKFSYNENKKSEINNNIVLDCYIRNKGSYSVVWLHENQLISLDDRIIKPDANIKIDTDLEKKFNLIINSLDVLHKGSYKCQIATLIAKNLEYNLDVLVPPSITRLPSNDIISVKEGESLSIQCIAQGNPKPKITWTKKGKLPAHVKIDELKSTLFLKDMDESYTDSYSCMAMNGVGNPVTSEFQINIKYKPKVKYNEQENLNNSVLYSSIGRSEKIICLINSYPVSKMSLEFNNSTIDSKFIKIEEVKNSDRKQYTLTYAFTTTKENVGEYKCIAENEVGISSDSISLSLSTSEIIIFNENAQVFSDAYVFEWSCLSGSQLNQLTIEVFSNYSLVFNQTIHIKQQHTQESSDSIINIHYRDFYELTQLNFNQTYSFHIKITNIYNSSEWSKLITFTTLNNENDRYTKHKQSIFHQTHHRHHDRKYKHFGLLQPPNSNFNSKQEKFQASMFNKSSNIYFNFIKLLPFILLNFFI